MHIKPLVGIGEKVEVGGVIGLYIRTNYFAYHHIPHIHIEICRDSTLRPSRAMELSSHSEFIRQKVLEDITKTNYLRLKVVSIHENFITCKVRDLNTQAGILSHVPTGSIGRIT